MAPNTGRCGRKEAAKGGETRNGAKVERPERMIAFSNRVGGTPIMPTEGGLPPAA